MLMKRREVCGRKIHIFTSWIIRLKGSPISLGCKNVNNTGRKLPMEILFAVYLFFFFSSTIKQKIIQYFFLRGFCSFTAINVRATSRWDMLWMEGKAIASLNIHRVNQLWKLQFLCSRLFKQISSKEQLVCWGICKLLGKMLTSWEKWKV